MGVLRTFNAIGDGLFGLVIKFIIIMLALVAIIGIGTALIVYWPFTVCFIIGMLISETMYHWLDKRLSIGLPEYFFININDFMATFSEGDELIEQTENELKAKHDTALQRLEEMREAVQSADTQLGKITSQRKLGTLFKRQTADVSPRLAKALEMELDKPTWASVIDKGVENDSGWDDCLC